MIGETAEKHASWLSFVCWRLQSLLYRRHHHHHHQPETVALDLPTKDGRTGLLLISRTRVVIYCLVWPSGACVKSGARFVNASGSTLKHNTTITPSFILLLLFFFFLIAKSQMSVMEATGATTSYCKSSKTVAATPLLISTFDAFDRRLGHTFPTTKRNTTTTCYLLCTNETHARHTHTDRRTIHLNERRSRLPA